MKNKLQISMIGASSRQMLSFFLRMSIFSLGWFGFSLDLDSLF
jgi:hypothetical protein